MAPSEPDDDLASGPWPDGGTEAKVATAERTERVEAGESGDGGEGVPPGPGDGGEEAPKPDDAARKKHRRRRVIGEWVAVIVVALGVAVVVRTFVLQTFFIPSVSMVPTLHVGDRILVDKLSYHLHGVGRGDIIVFSTPPGAHDPGVNDLVKRVIGLPGETIWAQDCHVLINGHRLKEPWLPNIPSSCTRFVSGPVHIPAGQYFVMGDNREDSSDSRSFGPISGSLIVGRVVVRIWPLSRFHFF